jgi:hypothetical protein
MSVDGEVVAKIIDAIAWPLVVGIVLLVGREPLVKLIQEIGRRSQNEPDPPWFLQSP